MTGSAIREGGQSSNKTSAAARKVQRAVRAALALYALGSPAVTISAVLDVIRVPTDAQRPTEIAV